MLKLQDAIVDIEEFLEDPYRHHLLLVNVENPHDYAELVRHFSPPLIRQLRLSAFCEADSMPDFDSFYQTLKNRSEEDGSVLALGVSESLFLQGEEAFHACTGQLLSTVNKGAKLVCLYCHGEPFLREYTKSNQKLVDCIMFVGDTRFGDRRVELLPPGGKDAEFVGINAYLARCEQGEAWGKCTVATHMWQGDYSRAMINVLVAGREMTSTVADPAQSEPERPAVPSAGMILLPGEDAMPLIERWKHADREQRASFFESLKGRMHTCRPYLQSALEGSQNSDGFVQNLYYLLLRIEPTSPDFADLYRERRTLLEHINDSLLADTYLDDTEELGDQQVYYLTDQSLGEQEIIMRWLSRQEVLDKRVLTVLQLISPRLCAYLLSADLSVEEYNEYFVWYKRQKLLNRVEPGFVELVEQHAVSREYDRWLPNVEEHFETLNKNDAVIYMLDSMGIEFMGYLQHQADQLGLDIDMQACAVNLPSTTAYNTNYLQSYKNIIKNIKWLDELKHKGEKNEQFQFSEYPLHLYKELDILDRVLHMAYRELNRKDVGRVLIVPDHGASRLAVIYPDKKTHRPPTKAHKLGRTCSYQEGMETPACSTVRNGFCILANYDRFSGRGAPMVETHGGATLEEVVVPVLQLTIRAEVITVYLKEQSIKVGRRLNATLRVFVSHGGGRIVVRINGVDYPAQDKEGVYHLVPLPNFTKPGSYTAEVYSDSKLLKELSFEAKSPVATERPMDI